MLPKPITVYTSDSSVPEFLSFVNVLSENLQQPVQLRGLSELPAPDTRRPTRQQLRAERTDLQQDLHRLLELLTFSRSYPRLAAEVDMMEQDITRLQERIQGINQLLGEEGGPADA